MVSCMCITAQYDPSKLTGNFLCWTAKLIYCSTTVRNRSEVTCTEVNYKANWMWKHVHGDWSQVLAQRTAWLQTPPYADSHRPHHRLVCISHEKSPQSEHNFLIPQSIILLHIRDVSGFKSQREDQLTGLMFLMAFISPSRHIPEQCLKLKPRPLPSTSFPIHDSLRILFLVSTL
jgi:hypothetical protein